MLPNVGPFEGYGMATVAKYKVCAQKIAQNLSPLTLHSLLDTWCTSRFNIQQLYVLPTLYFFFYFVFIWEQTATCAVKWLVFITVVGKCLLRGTNCIFKYSCLRFIFKRLFQEPSSSSYEHLNKVCFIGKSGRNLFCTDDFLNNASKLWTSHEKLFWFHIFVLRPLPKSKFMACKRLDLKCCMFSLRMQDAVCTTGFSNTGLRPTTGSWDVLHWVATTVLSLIFSESPS